MIKGSFEFAGCICRVRRGHFSLPRRQCLLAVDSSEAKVTRVTHGVSNSNLPHLHRIFVVLSAKFAHNQLFLAHSSHHCIFCHII